LERSEVFNFDDEYTLLGFCAWLFMLALVWWVGGNYRDMIGVRFCFRILPCYTRLVMPPSQINVVVTLVVLM
jgi:hypothetical protein